MGGEAHEVIADLRDLLGHAIQIEAVKAVMGGKVEPLGVFLIDRNAVEVGALGEGVQGDTLGLGAAAGNGERRQGSQEAA